jgi:hypothetical protein
MQLSSSPLRQTILLLIIYSSLYKHQFHNNSDSANTTSYSVASCAYDKCPFKKGTNFMLLPEKKHRPDVIPVTHINDDSYSQSNKMSLPMASSSQTEQHQNYIKNQSILQCLL